MKIKNLVMTILVLSIMSILIGCSKPFEPKDIKVKDGVVTTSIKTFKDISTQNKRLWVQKEMFEIGFKNLKEQIERYNETNTTIIK